MQALNQVAVDTKMKNVPLSKFAHTKGTSKKLNLFTFS
tara:strand:- start:1907 stop:2020 length:114 start_codon:yes stop_codon:yes gene_type:complete